MLLPAEIQDEIVDHLAGDTHALKVCALTCRQWTRSAHKSLFRTFYILNDAEYTRAKGMLTASPRIAQLVRVLTLSKPSTEPAALDYQWPELLLTMPRVEELNVDKLRLFPRNDVGESLKSYFSRLRTLRFLGIHDIDHKDFMKLSVALHSVSELYLSGRTHIVPDLSTNPVLEPRIKRAAASTLRSLTIRATSSPNISCVLSCFPWQTSLVQLQIRFENTAPESGYGDLLRVAAPVVEEFVLQLPHHLPLLSILRFPVPFQKIRRLHLKHAALEIEPHNDEHSNWMITALSHVSRWDARFQLREIVLSFPAPGTGGRSQLLEGAPLLPMTGFPFPWVQLDMVMATLAQENDRLVFTLNIWDLSCGREVRSVSLTDRSLGRYRLRVSRMEESHPHALTVSVGPWWNPIGCFGGKLCDQPSLIQNMY